jgi:hypothetical protein
MSAVSSATTAAPLSALASAVNVDASEAELLYRAYLIRHGI